MRWPWARPLAYRRLIRVLEQIAAAQDAQVVLLARLADQVAPVPATSPLDDQARTIDYVDFDEMAEALRFTERMRQQTGHTPTDDEVIEHLAEIKTVAWQESLNDAAGRSGR